MDKWMFMPRYVSSEKFDPKTIKHAGSNIVLMADEHFDNVQVRVHSRLSNNILQSKIHKTSDVAS